MNQQIQRCIFLFIFTPFLKFSYASNLEILEQELSDSMISTKITTKFTKDPHLNPLKIFVSTDHGVVTLSGHVKDKESFITALRLTKSTQGVKGIEAEQLDIKQVNTTLTDAYITAKVEAAILKAKVLDDESIPLVGINVSTSNGIVTLSGTVKHSQSISSLLKRALLIQGVKQVISKLHVAPAPIQTSQIP